MKSSFAGQYMALEMPAEVIQSLPKPVATAWTRVLTAQQEWRKSKTVLAELQQMKEAAGAVDHSVDRELRGKIEDQLRIVVKAADDADTAEVNFMARLHEHRREMADGYKAQALQELEEANAIIRTLNTCIDKFGVSLSLWNWSRATDDKTPPTSGTRVYLRRYLADAIQLLADISHEIDKQSPDAILAAEAKYLREWQLLNGKATTDGLVLNDAAHRAYSR